MTGSTEYVPEDPADIAGRGFRRSVALLSVVALALILVIGSVSAAFAADATETVPPSGGKAATGEPLFYPCTGCHPVLPGEVEQGRAFPNDFTGHQITLRGHAILGEGDAACLVCHDDPARDPGKFKLIDGSLVDITGDLAQVCFRCHMSMYREFEAGMHGAGKAKCSSAGCHNPHTPGYIFGGGLLPFVGNGFQFQVLPEMEKFTPLAGPPERAPYHDPEWLRLLALAGVVAAGGIAVALVRGGSDR